MPASRLAGCNVTVTRFFLGISVEIADAVKFGVESTNMYS